MNRIQFSGRRGDANAQMTLPAPAAYHDIGASNISNMGTLSNHHG